jgi:hypothetical protein
MKVQLVFHDWIEELSEKSVYCTKKGTELSLGDFHSGTMFSAEIEIEDYQGEFEDAAKDGIVPVFYALLAKDQEGTE